MNYFRKVHIPKIIFTTKQHLCIPLLGMKRQELLLFVVHVISQGTRRTFVNGVDDLLRSCVFWCNPWLFFRLKNVGIVTNTVTRMDAFPQLPYDGYFSIGIFFFDIV